MKECAQLVGAWAALRCAGRPLATKELSIKSISFEQLDSYNTKAPRTFGKKKKMEADSNSSADSRSQWDDGLFTTNAFRFCPVEQMFGEVPIKYAKIFEEILQKIVYELGRG